MQLRLVVAALCVAAPASAFPTGGQFDQDAVMNDGGGGIAFDGAPRFAGHTCEVCHTDAPHLIGVKLEADAPELFSSGYTPAHQYHLRVVLENEHAGLQYVANGPDCGQIDATPFKPCDDNGFGLELDDSSGAVAGTFVPVIANACSTAMADDPIVHILKDNAVVHEQHNGRTSWDVCWTAPAAGTGTVTAYVAVVDGNGGTGSAAFPNDTIDDDVAAGAVPIAEAGGAAMQNAGGCNATGDASLLVAALILLLARGRKRLIAILGVLAVAATTGCIHVRPRQRETLAHRNMTFAPDPAEDELDLHMQESREGSSGGYGSSGGGCGCN
ncbi:MAG: DUF4266 domain-containing protein [Kofleriaceae bacterium]